MEGSKRGITVIKLVIIIAIVAVVAVTAILVIPKISSAAQESAARKDAEAAYATCIENADNKAVLEKETWFVQIGNAYYIMNAEGKMEKTEKRPIVGDYVIKADGTLTEPEKAPGGAD